MNKREIMGKEKIENTENTENTEKETVDTANPDVEAEQDLEAEADLDAEQIPETGQVLVHSGLQVQHSPVGQNHRRSCRDRL